MCRQPLIAPLDLSLSAIDDLTLREHLPLFEQNGFGFVEDAASGHMRLNAVPFSKGTTFGAADVHELVCYHFCAL
jgi:DNA mismatch repair protein PMS2